MLLAAVALLGGADAPDVPPAVADFVTRLAAADPEGSEALTDPAVWADLATDLPVSSADAVVLLRFALAALAEDPRRPVVLVNLIGRLLAAHEAGVSPLALDQATALVRQVGPDVTHPDLLSNAGLALLALHERDDDLAALDEAVALLRRAADGPDRESALSNLGLALRTRGDRIGDAASLDEAVALARDVAARTPLDAPAGPGRRVNLATALRVRVEHGGPVALLHEARAAVAEAADGPPDHPDRATVLAGLGTTLLALARETGDGGAAALSALRAAVAVAPDPATTTAWSADLCLALLGEGERLRDPALLAEAVGVALALVDATDPGHPHRAARAATAATACLTGAEAGGPDDLLDRAVELATDAVERTPAGHPDRPGHLSGLGLAHLGRYERTGVRADAGAAVAACSGALDLLPAGHPELPSCATNAALADLAAADAVPPRDRAGALAHLTAAIAHAGTAVATTRAGDPGSARRLTNLALALLAHAQATGSVESLDRAVAAARGAVAAAPAGDGQVAGWWSNLSLVLRRRGEHDGDPAVLIEARDAATTAVAATPDGDGDRPGFLNNLSCAELALFERVGGREHVDAAVAAARAAVAACPAGHRDRPGFLASLALALHAASARFGDPVQLDEAVALLTEAVAATPPDAADHPRFQVNLVGALHARYGLHGELADLDAAVAAGRPARDDLAGHPDRAAVLHNLGHALQARFERTGAAADLVDALAVGQEAVAGAGPTTAGTVRAGLANALMLQVAATAADVSVRRRAIALYREALARVPVDHPDRAGWLANLSTALRGLYEATGEDPALLDEAVAAADEAVAALGPGDADRGTLLFVRASAVQTRQTDLTDAPGVAAVVEGFRAAALTAGAPPAIRAQAAAEWGRTAAAAGDAADGVAGLALAVEQVTRIVPRTLRRADQEHRLARLAGIASDAAAAAAAHGDVARAVRLLEQGRGVLLGQALDTRTDLAAVRDVAPADAERFAQLCRALDESPPGHGRVDRVALAAELDVVVARIRAHRDLADFLAPPDTTLWAAAADGPVVLVNISVLGSHAFVVSATGVDAIELPDLEPGLAGVQVTRFRVALDEALTALPGLPRRTAAEDVLHGVLEWLWDAVAGPVLARCPAPRMWWSATGLLALLPLHAAGHHRDGSGRTVLDLTVCSTTPTLRALAHARRPQPPGGPAPGSWLVVETATAGLPGTRAEAAHLRALGVSSTVLDGGISVPGVLAQLPHHRCAHFGCHGVADPAHPSDSGLDVSGAGDLLTVAAVSRLQLDHAELAVLAACDTARTGPVLTDEVINLASAFQLAGYRQVVGTLWPVLDTVAVRLNRRVHAAVARAGLDALPHALHAAVVDLRRRHLGLPSVWAAHLHAGR